MTIITHTVIGGPSSALVVPDGSPTYSELLIELESVRKKLIEAEHHAACNWSILEDVACGANLNLVK